MLIYKDTTHPSVEQPYIDQLVNTWSQEAGVAMLELTSERLASFALRLMAFKDSTDIEPAGHVGVALEDEGVYRIGGLVVNPAFRHQGIAGDLFRQSLSMLDSMGKVREVFAFVNNDSAPAVSKLGATITERTDPSETDCIFVADLMPVLHRLRTDTDVIIGSPVVPEPSAVIHSLDAYRPHQQSLAG